MRVKDKYPTPRKLGSDKHELDCINIIVYFAKWTLQNTQKYDFTCICQKKVVPL